MNTNKEPDEVTVEDLINAELNENDRLILEVLS